MKTKFKLSNRILNLVLALVMMAGMLPFTALAAEEVVKYDLWLGSERFTSQKLTIAGQTGTATYDPDTRTLTLDHYTYIGDGPDDSAYITALVSAAEDLNIVLKGENKLISTCACHTYNYGIYNGNGFTTIIGEDTQNDSLLVQSKGEQHSAGIFTYSKGIRVENCTLTVKSEVKGEANFGMVISGETTLRNCIVDVFCANARGLQSGIRAKDGVNIDNSMVTASAAGGEAIRGQINLNYPDGYAWKVSEDGAYSTEPFAYNQESYLAIKPLAFMATWTDGDGASYEKKFKYGEVITIPTNEFFEDTFRKSGYTLTQWQGYTEGMTMPFGGVTFTASYTPNQYTVTFNPNGGDAIASATVTYGEKYGKLPSSAITGLSGGDSNWYLVDRYGNVTDTKITKLSKVTQTGDHTLFVKRKVLAPSVKLTLSVSGGISDNYQYYIPDNSTRILTATVSNKNDEILNYTYQWYKDGNLIDGETGATLTLAGNVADSGKYKVVVTATLKDDADIIVDSDSASGEKELQVKILHQANTVKYDANGGEGGPSSNYTGGTTATVSSDAPTRENYIFQGWNTQADGTGESYTGGDTYTFLNDNGNGGCTAMLYAQWKGESKTVTYMIDGEIFKTDTVEYGKDAVLSEIPEKEGYTGIWNHDGKNITVDTVISAVYTEIPETDTPSSTNPDTPSSTEPNTESSTEPDTESSTEPDTESSTETNTESSTKPNTENSTKPNTQGSPKTGDNSNMMLWFALLFISGGALITLNVDRKKKAATK